jgi:uncharacterized protein (TIGR00730 family)
MDLPRRICIYCGSAPGRNPAYTDAARRLGRCMAQRGIGLVYGGGSVGMMGAVADGALEAGGHVIGVIPRKLMDMELAHQGIQELYVTEGMHDRKLMLAKLSGAFISMPGGWGTLEELSETATWAQLEYHSKPMGLLNILGFFDPLVGWLEHARGQGFVRTQTSELLICDTEPEALVGRIEDRMKI